ncbi:hypothetical protein [Lentibacillus sp. Marseille-P4043]|nr:hypothetical protein [Lentibacillus sp. Marseille-P4043]
MKSIHNFRNNHFSGRFVIVGLSILPYIQKDEENRTEKDVYDKVNRLY